MFCIPNTFLSCTNVSRKHFKNIPRNSNLWYNTEYCLGAFCGHLSEKATLSFCYREQPELLSEQMICPGAHASISKTEILLKTLSWDMLMHPAPCSHSEASTNFVAAFVGKRGNKAQYVSSLEVTTKICAYFFWKPKFGIDTKGDCVRKHILRVRLQKRLCDSFSCWWIKWD